MAGGGVEPEPEVVEQLEVVAGDDRADGLGAGVEVGEGDGAGEDARQGPGGDQPEQ